MHEADGYPVEGVSSPKAWLQLRDPLGQWTALLDGRPVGHVAVVPPQPADHAPQALSQGNSSVRSDLAVLVRLFVHPGARGRAISAALLDIAESQAQEAGRVLTLDVMRKDHLAIAIYEQRGWRPLGEFEHMSGDAAGVPAISYFLPPSEDRESQ